MEKISLVITSLNPDDKKLDRLLTSAKGFDEIIVHVDVNSINTFPNCLAFKDGVTKVFCPDHLKIEEAYNWIIKNHVKTTWVCLQPDDDYFEEEGLSDMLKAIRNGEAVDCDVCTFRTFVTGYAPWRDKGSVLAELINRCCAPLMRFGVEVKARRWYGYKGNLTPESIAYQSNIPHGAFFRKSIWDKVGGMNGSIAHDWILWLKMARSGAMFKYFPFIVYVYERREGSAWFRQFKEIAGSSMTKLRQIVDKEATVNWSNNSQMFK